MSETVEVYKVSGAKFDHPMIYGVVDTLNSVLLVGLDINLRDAFRIR